MNTWSASYSSSCAEPYHSETNKSSNIPSDVSHEMKQALEDKHTIDTKEEHHAALSEKESLHNLEQIIMEDDLSYSQTKRKRRTSAHTKKKRKTTSARKTAKRVKDSDSFFLTTLHATKVQTLSFLFLTMNRGEACFALLSELGLDAARDFARTFGGESFVVPTIEEMEENLKRVNIYLSFQVQKKKGRTNFLNWAKKAYHLSHEEALKIYEDMHEKVKQLQTLLELTP